MELEPIGNRPLFILLFLLQGFNQEELEADSKQPKQQQQAADESDSDEGVDRSGQE